MSDPPVTSPNNVSTPARLTRATSDTNTLPLNLFGDTHTHDDEKVESSAEIINRFLVKCRKYARIHARFAEGKMAESLAVLCGAHESVPTLSFEEGSKLLASAGVISAAKWILSSTPRDEVLLGFARESRGPRAFLSSSMVVHHPVHVLSDGEDVEGYSHRIEKALLTTACRIVLTAVKGLRVAVQEGGRRALIEALDYFAFARKFQAAALTAWRRVDSERLAASIVNPYSQTFAMMIAAARMQDQETEGAAKQQLLKMRAAMRGLLSEAKAKSVLDEVEVAVRCTMEDAFEKEDEAARAEKLKRDERREELLEEQKVKEKEREEEAKLQKKQSDFVGKFLTNMSVTNERLCHEIILDPTYRIPGSSQEEEEGKEGLDGEDNNPALEHAKRIQDQMKRVFWDGLVVSLTPPLQESAKDFVAGADVQVRYGANGAYYSASIVEVNDEGSDDEDEDENGEALRKYSYDVKFSGDNVVHKRIPVHLFRVKGDPINYKPLLKLVDEVKGKLIGIAPKKGSYIEAINSNIDLELMEQMLSKDAFTGGSMGNLINFVCGQIVHFQAPVRNKKTGEWIKAYMNEVDVAIGQGAEGGGFVRLLPKFLEWVFVRIDETTKDIANSHIEMLRPKLKENGKEYEKSAFNARLAEGKLRLVNTQIFCRDALGFVVEGGVDGADKAVLMRCAKREPMGFVKFLAAGFVALLRRPVRLDTPGYETYEGGLPETLLWDCSKLAMVRDVMDSVSLISTMVVLLRQVLARNGFMGGGGGGEFDQVTRDLGVLVKSGGVRLPDLEAYIVKKACELCPGLSEEEQTSLKSIISSSASPDNAVFKLYSKRIDKLVFDCLVHMKKEVWGKDGDQLNGKIMSSGFGLFIKEIADVMKGLISVFQHTLVVHNEHYTKLCLESIEEHIKKSSTAKVEEKTEEKTEA
ncbi:hypothetical protein TrST_g4665 [Triparma strigata]|uniref:Uncharacterized protein n=1 Tax=Triparma strigata TaxID=1606541 RepID=A0A9W7DT58_9STRA|nr:hypothetical protein TrST_g4665 [Triparma strigata]